MRTKGSRAHTGLIELGRSAVGLVDDPLVIGLRPRHHLDPNR
jgi:hypothetical protein